MLCIVRGNELYIRATKWSQTEDFVWECSRKNRHLWSEGKWWVGNKYFNLETAYTCPSNCANHDLARLSLFKYCTDDICPIMVQGTMIGANHGFGCVDEVVAYSHGKTEADIGSVWLDSMFRTYCLIKILDQDRLHFVMFDTESMANGRMVSGKPRGKLLHSTGATHKEDVVIAEVANAQLFQCFNHYSMKFFINELEQDIVEEGVLYGEKFVVETQYDIIYVPAMLQYLMEHVGQNTNESQHSEKIKDSYLRLCMRYEFHENGSITTDSYFSINKDLELGYIGLVQSLVIGGTPHTYVPDTTYSQIVKQDRSEKHVFSKDTWKSKEKAPYRYYQFADASCKKGMALVYDRQTGWGVNEERLKRLNHAGYYNVFTRKQYPYFISGGSLRAGEQFRGVAAKIPLCCYDEDMTDFCCYWVENDIILMIDVHDRVNKDIILPDYMNHKKIEILDQTENCRIEQSEIENSKLSFQADDYGYAVMRLYERGKEL